VPFSHLGHSYQPSDISSQDGSGDLYITTRAAPSTPFGFLATRKDVGLFVASMLQRTPQGVYGPPVVADSTTLTFEGVCEALGKVVGRKIVYRQAALGEMGTHYPVFGGEFDQLYELFNNYGFSGGQKTLGREEVPINRFAYRFSSADLTLLAWAIEGHDIFRNLRL